MFIYLKSRRNLLIIKWIAYTLLAYTANDCLENSNPRLLVEFWIWLHQIAKFTSFLSIISVIVDAKLLLHDDSENFKRQLIDWWNLNFSHFSLCINYHEIRDDLLTVKSDLREKSYQISEISKNVHYIYIYRR